MNRLLQLITGWFTTRDTSPGQSLVVRNDHSLIPATPRPKVQPIRPVYGPDHIGIVGFHDQGFVITRPVMPFSPGLIERSQTLHRRLGGLTNITDGLRQSLNLLLTTPPGAYRKIWLLSDGEPNVETEALFSIVSACEEARININTIGFGNTFDEGLLREIAGATRQGKFVSVQSLRELSLVLAETRPQRPRQPHRRETTVLAIDCSYSMREPMGGRRKIEVVEEAILHLLHFKQRLFS